MCYHVFQASALYKNTISDKLYSMCYHVKSSANALYTNVDNDFIFKCVVTDG